MKILPCNINDILNDQTRLSLLTQDVYRDIVGLVAHEQIVIEGKMLTFITKTVIISTIQQLSVEDTPTEES